MGLIRQQFIEALGYKGKTLSHYRDFTLTVVAGIALLFGEIFAMQVRSGGSSFDLEVTIGCFGLALLCVVLAKNRLLVFGCCLLVPAGLVGWNLAGHPGMVRRFFFIHVAIGVSVLVMGGLLKVLVNHLRTRRGR